MFYGGRTFHCHVKTGHGWLDLKNAMAQSCDIYYWTIGRDYLGIEKIASYAREFGFGQSAQIDLPSQVSGLVPTAEWKEKKYHEKWLCRRCFETIAEHILIPGEDNHIFFPVGWHRRYSSAFHFMRCKKCSERTDRDMLTEEEFQINIER